MRRWEFLGALARFLPSAWQGNLAFCRSRITIIRPEPCLENDHETSCSRAAGDLFFDRRSFRTIVRDQAVSKEGKPLAGAAKTSAIKKCCKTAAVSKEGKPLAGAAKNSFVKKCVSEG